MKTARERFEKKYQKLSNGCWLWTAAKNQVGDGMFAPIAGKTVSAARYAYEMCFGPIPAGMMITHHCGNRCCVNPQHIVLVNGRRPVEPSMPYPNADNRLKAVKILRWMQSMYPPLLDDIDQLMIKLTHYGQRKPLMWRPDDFADHHD